MRTLLLICICLFPLSSFAQNLVLNPSFENLKKEKNKGFSNHKDFNENVLHWTSPTNATTDYINTNPEIKPKQIKSEFGELYTAGFFPPKSGEKMTGIHTYGNVSSGYCPTTTDGEIREYLQGTLAKPLEVGKEYFVRFWVAISNNQMSTNNIGVYFSKAPIKNDDCYRLEFTPHVNESKVLEFKKNGWSMVSGKFIAKEPFQYLIIGNFFSDKATKTYSKKMSSSAYVYIDDVYVSETLTREQIAELRAKKKVKPKTNTIAEKVKTEKTIVLNGVFFKTNSAELEQRSFKELNELADWLMSNPNQKIMIKGHTDNQGNDNYNNELSNRRAKSVLDFLLKKNVKPIQLSSKGFGSSVPVADNSTEEGRSKNRRVEFEIL